MKREEVPAYLRGLAMYEANHRCEDAALLLNSTADLLENIGVMAIQKIEIENITHMDVNMVKVYTDQEGEKA